VERVYGDDVKRDVAQKLVESSIGEALEEHALKPVAPPRVENGEVAEGLPFKYVATVEVIGPIMRLPSTRRTSRPLPPAGEACASS
jgi:FKBP-type peptidyl-prolyl cis-trans isomerase (trigger factor)